MNRTTLSALLTAALALLASLLSAREPDRRPVPVNYARPFEPPTRPAFIPLPPGHVEPRGWLRDWCLAARDGMTGHLDELDPSGHSKAAYEHGWTADTTTIPDLGAAKRDPMEFFPRPVNSVENFPYWLDGMIRLGYVLHDDFLLNKVKSRYDIIIDKTNKDSLLFMWWINRNDPQCLKQFGEYAKWLFAEAEDIYYSIQLDSAWVGNGLAVYYAGSGDERVLRALETAYSGERRWIDGRGCWTNAFPAYETYTWTGNKEIQDVLTNLYRTCKLEEPKIPAGGFLGDDSFPINVRHNVFLHEGTGPWPIGYLWTGNRLFLDRTRLWFELLERDSMQPFGVNVGDEWLGRTGAFRGTETCSVVQYMWNYLWLLRIAGEGHCGDRLERAFFNAAPAAVSRDFKTHVYFQSPNRISRNLPGAEKGFNNRFNFRPSHPTKCCTYNLHRMVPNYVMHMWMATYDNGLAWTLYGPCAANALAGNGIPVKLESTTAYPFEETIQLTVSPRQDAEFPLYFRLPGWCEAPSIKVNGSDMDVSRDAHGFARIARRWKQGDRVELHFPMPVRVMGGHDHGVDGKGPDAAGGPYASIYVGPLLMALPIPDLDANTADNSAVWQYAFDTPSPKAAGRLAVKRSAMPEKWDWPLRSPLELSLPAVRADWAPTALSNKIKPICMDKQYALPLAPLSGKETETIKLVPYGCTKFRISMFPVTARSSWVAEEPKPGVAKTVTVPGTKAEQPWIKGEGPAPVQEQQCVTIKLPDAAAKSDLYGVSFIDALNGWIVGDKGLCLRTTDGGNQWTVLKLESQATLRAVQFHASGTGWACGDGDPKAPPPSGLGGHIVSGRPNRAATLLHTTDGGTTWTANWLPTNFESPCLAGTSQSVVIGTSGGSHHLDGDLLQVERANDAFTLRREGAYRALFALAAVSDDRWIAAGSPVSLFFLTFTSSPLRTQGKCRILFSADGGKTWEPAKGSDGKGCLRGLATHGAKAAVAVGDNGQILRSEDGGRNWQTVARKGGEQFLAAAWSEDGTLAAVGQKGTVLTSKDEGKTWKPLKVENRDDLRAISAAGKFFYVVGGKGTVLRLSCDGGRQETK